MLTGEFARNEDAEVRDWTAWALSMPAGQWLVGIAGLTVTCVAIGLAIAGIRRRFATRLRKSEEGSGLAILLGTIGFLARSLVFILIGCFLIFAAWHTNAREATGFGGASTFLDCGRWAVGVRIIRRVGGALRPARNPPASAVRAKMNKMNGEF